MSVHSKLWCLQHFRMLDALTDAQKLAVHNMTRMLEVPRGQRIYLAGDPSDPTAHEDTVLCALNRDLLLQMVQQSPALGH